ncbi:MAG: glyoxalase/bleomycin resistance/extradiol dioxygenase family protein [Bacteroidetes bacterium]|nr:MAG: glyoxalase/bleomycin resistance/extradiol dioxygenase family protein [Bacteroidota bacterium]
MATNMYLNIPVKDLNKSNDFFKKLGFSFNPQFSNEQATCVIISESIFVMMVQEEMFKGFSKKEICDTKKSTEVFIGLSAESKEKVIDMVNAAVEAGGSVYSEPQDHGWMYSHSFADLDGHQWDLFFMDMSAMPK